MGDNALQELQQKLVQQTNMLKQVSGIACTVCMIAKDDAMLCSNHVSIESVMLLHSTSVR